MNEKFRLTPQAERDISDIVFVDRADCQPIEIVHVVHGARDPDNLLGRR